MKRLRPDLPACPVKPPTRQAYQKMRKKHLATDEALERQLETHVEIAVGQARSIGCLDPEGSGSPTHPSKQRTLYGDGIVHAECDAA